MNDESFEPNQIDHPDAALLERLRASSATFGASVPNDVHQGALAAFAWRSVDEELAALLSDSADSNRLVGARATMSGMRILEFVTSVGQISIGLAETGLIAGTLAGHSGENTRLVSASGQCVDLVVDEFGEFLCDQTLPSPVRIEVGVGPGRVVTDWILPPR
jgi:hypothetical protein